MRKTEPVACSAAQAHQIPQLSVHLVTTDFPPSHGGLETYSAELVAKLQAIHEVSAGLGKAPAPQWPDPTLSAPRCHWHRSRNRIGAALWSTLDGLRYHRPQGARLHMQWNTALISAWQRRTGHLRRLYVCVHGVELIETRPALRALTHALMRFVFTHADAVVAGSHATAKLMVELGLMPAGPRLIVNPYGTAHPPPQEERAKPGSSTTLRLLCVHRLVARKGTRLLLESLASHADADWHLTVAGDGPEAPSLIALAQQLGLASRIRFMGAVDAQTKARLYREADLFILPSLPPEANHAFEGLGLGLLEAQAHGLPVLAAATGGIPEALAIDSTGWLFTAGSATSLSHSIAKVLHLHRHAPETLARMGRAGPPFIAAHYLWDRTIAAWKKLLAEGA